jgi:hypothetical protein
MPEREHNLKTWPEAFEAVLSGRKTHEWRRDDRGNGKWSYEVNDLLRLEEFIPCHHCNGSGKLRDYTDVADCCDKPHGKYTGRHTTVFVTYVTRHPEFGVPDDFVVMSIGPRRVEFPSRDPRLDPRPGDHVDVGVNDERAEVLAFLTDRDEHDHQLGSLPYVSALVTDRYGQVSRSTMSLATWRWMFPAKKES